MTETRKLESLLAGANGGEVKIPRKDAHELAQKLKARGGGAALRQLETRLRGSESEISIPGSEAHALLEELRASGRRWVFGAEPARKAEEPPPEHELEPEPQPEPQRERTPVAEPPADVPPRPPEPTVAAPVAPQPPAEPAPAPAEPAAAPAEPVRPPLSESEVPQEQALYRPPPRRNWLARLFGRG
jgi:hypothetical protein